VSRRTRKRPVMLRRLTHMSDRLVVIQVNRKAGTGRRHANVRALISRLRTHGFRVRPFSKPDRLDQFLAEIALRPWCIVAGGGDGTVGSILNRFPDIPVAILPAGTENLLAKYLRVPVSGREIADVIAAGHVRRLDLGIASGHRFTLMASAGFDADVVHRLDAVRTGSISKFTYVQPILASLRNYRHPPLRVVVDGFGEALPARLVLVFNLPAYARGLPVASGARGDDGVLDLRVFERGSGFQMIRYCYKVAIGSHEALSDVRVIRARQVRIESDEPVPLQLDGDPAGTTPVDISVEAGAAQFLVPQSIPSSQAVESQSSL